MIPRLAGQGTSFKGAALYYLHDKREEGEAERGTSARVAWTYTLNLPTQDPDRAWRMMAHTAMSQAELKAASGVKATGRKLSKPVMAYSLAWSPDEDPPAPHEMLKAAQDSLAALGLEGHQAIVICHNDTAHPHVHVLVNRVNPENGIAHNGSRSKLKLSEWAEAYEQSRGRVLCVERVENNERRRRGLKNGRAETVSRPQWQAASVDPERAAEWATTHADMFASQAATERAGHDRRFEERAAFFAQRRAGRNAIRDRYQAAIDRAHRPELAVEHARLADLLLRLDPSLGLATLTQDHSTFTRHDLIRHIGRHTVSVKDFEAVLSRLETSPELVHLGRDEQGRQRFTTREQQALEQRMLDHAQWLHVTPKRAVSPVRVKGLTLSRDQEAALHHVVRAGGLASIVGYAGTGKSTLLAAARRSWEAAGLTVQGMALSGIAADGLRNGSGIDSRTIHNRLHQWEQGIGRPGARDVIVLDEAGMVGSRQMERILHYAAQGGAKVVLVGDPEQLQAIDAGGAFRMIVDRFEAVHLDTVRRQKAAWQQDATRALATGRTDEAIDRYEAAGMVHGHTTADQAKDALIAQWQRHRLDQPQDSQIILAFRRSDVRDLNDRARAVMRQSGMLGPDVRLTTVEGKRTFAAGDRIYFTKNDAGLGVRNGTLATILRIDRQTLTVQLDGQDGQPGRKFMFGMANYSHIDHGYAATIHKSQGITVDRAHLLAGRNLNRHATYVAMSRHRDRLDVHWSLDTFADGVKLRRELGRAAVKDTSLDYEPEATPHDQAQTARADRLAAIRVRMRQGFAGDHHKPVPLKPVGRIGQKAMHDLKRAVANRQDQQKQPVRQKAEPTRTQIEGPRPSDRVAVIMTAEMIEFDRETAELSRVLGDRHDSEIETEKQARRSLTIDAAYNWREITDSPPDLAPDPELDEEFEALLARRPKGPAPSM